MSIAPFVQLARFKGWANRGLNTVVREHLDRLPERDAGYLKRILDHAHVVDEIFQHHLLGKPHGYTETNSPDPLPFSVLASEIEAMDDWYIGYAEGLTPERVEEMVSFTYTTGASARMTRGEILLHVMTHAGYHRGNAGVILRLNGITPNPDRLTDFLDSGKESGDGA